jgi:hypothetical protein
MIDYLTHELPFKTFSLRIAAIDAYLGFLLIVPSLMTKHLHLTFDVSQHRLFIPSQLLITDLRPTLIYFCSRVITS